MARDIASSRNNKRKQLAIGVPGILITHAMSKIIFHEAREPCDAQLRLASEVSDNNAIAGEHALYSFR